MCEAVRACALGCLWMCKRVQEWRQVFAAVYKNGMSVDIRGVSRFDLAVRR